MPEPDGPTRPTASPAPILTAMSLRIWTRAAPRPSERLTPESEIAGGRGATEVSFMRSVLRLFGPYGPRSYGMARRVVQIGRIVALSLACLALPDSRPEPTTRSRSSHWAIRSPPGFGLSRQDAFPAKLEAALRAKGIAVSDRECGRLGRYHRGRACPARLVGAGWNRRRDPRARRQRCAARARPESRPNRAGNHPETAAKTARFRCCSPECWRRAISGPTTRPPSTRSTRTSRRPMTSSSTRSSSTGSRPTRALNQGDGLHPTAAGVDVIVARILPKRRGAARPGEGAVTHG